MPTRKLQASSGHVLVHVGHNTLNSLIIVKRNVVMCAAGRHSPGRVACTIYGRVASSARTCYEAILLRTRGDILQVGFACLYL